MNNVCHTTGQECPKKIGFYFPGCSRECEHNPACVDARREKEDKAAARIAANRDAYDRQLLRAPCVGAKAPRREDPDATFLSGATDMPVVKNLNICPICGHTEDLSYMLDNLNICYPCYAGLAAE
jgi:hypothetical protein